ncbi:MAG: aspartate-semialdehyde dehydrogenase [Bacteroidota bacterium]
MKLAVVGASGLVGREIIKVLEERNIHPSLFIPVASPKSVGKSTFFNGQDHIIRSNEEAIALKPDFAIFSAGGSTSLEWAQQYAAAGTTVIDNSSAWRMEPHIPLIVPEINASILTKKEKIIANPNCSTIQMVMALAPLHKAYKIRRIVVSTYQSVTGTGAIALYQLLNEREGNEGAKAYPHPIDLNLFPHGGTFTANGYTTEEIKLETETRKILGDDSIMVTATVVRVPLMGGHSEAVNVQFEKEFDLDELRDLLSHTPGIVIHDEPEKNIYPMPLTAQGKDDVFVGRIRRDFSCQNGLNLFIVADNLRKGAATNAVQILQYLLTHTLSD